MKNVQATISPLLFVLCLCGFGVFEYPQDRPRLYLTIFYILISWLLYAYILFKTITLLERFEIEFVIALKSTLIFAVLYMLLYLYYNKKFKICLNKLSIANNTLEKLGISKNYAKLRIRIIRLIIGWVVSIFVMNTVDSLWYHEQFPESYVLIGTCIPFIINHSIHINALNDLMYTMLIWYMGSLFEHVNQRIQELIEQKKQQVRQAWATSTSSLIRRQMAGTETSKSIIWILMHVHHELCLILCELNAIFGLQILTQAIAFHVFTVQLIKELYRDIVRLYTDPTYEVTISIFTIYIWSITGIVKMFIFNYVCEEACAKANRTEAFLNRLTNLIFDVETQENIMQFVFQILRKPLRISGLGLFYFGYKFMYECVSFIGTITVLVIQSHAQKG